MALATDSLYMKYSNGLYTYLPVSLSWSHHIRFCHYFAHHDNLTRLHGVASDNPTLCTMSMLSVQQHIHIRCMKKVFECLCASVVGNLWLS